MFLDPPSRDIEYVYRVKKVPYIENSLKQVTLLIYVVVDSNCHIRKLHDLPCS